MEGFPVDAQLVYEADDGFDLAFENLSQVADQPMCDASLAVQAIYNDMLDAEQQLGQLTQETSSMQSAVESPMIVEENGDVTDIGSFSSPPPPLPSSEGWYRWREFVSYSTEGFTGQESFWDEFIRVNRSRSQLKFLQRNDELPIDTKELTIEWHANLPIQSVFVLNKKGRMLIGIPNGPHSFCFNHTSSTSVLKSSSRLFTTTNIFVFVVNWNGERRFLSFALYSNFKKNGETRRNIDTNQFSRAFHQVNKHLEDQLSAEKKRKRSNEEQGIDVTMTNKQQKVTAADATQVAALSPAEKAVFKNNYINLFKKVRKEATSLDPAEFAFIFHYLTEFADDRWTDRELFTSLSFLMPSLNQQDQLLDVSSTNLQRFGSLYDCTRLSLDTIVQYGPVPDEVRTKIGEFDYVHVGNKYVACINTQYMLATHIYYARQRILSTLKMGSNIVGLLENGELFIILTNSDQCTTVKSEEKIFNTTTTGYLRKVNNNAFLLIKYGQSIENVYWCTLNEQKAVNITELPQLLSTERTTLRISALPGVDKIVAVNKDTEGSLWLNAFLFSEATSTTQFTIQQVAEPYKLPTNLDLKSVHLVNESVVAILSTNYISFFILEERGFIALPNSTQLHYRKDGEKWSIYSVITGMSPNEIWVCYGFDAHYRFSCTPTIIGYKMDHNYQFDKIAAFIVKSEDRLIRSETKLILYRSQANYYHPLRSNYDSSSHYSISDVTSKGFSLQCNDLKRSYELNKISDDELLVCNGLTDSQTEDFSQALWCEVGKKLVLASNASKQIEITSDTGYIQCTPYPHQLNDTNIIHLHSLGDKALLETVSGALFVLTIKEDRFHALMGPISRDTIYRQKGSSIVFSNQFMIGTRTNNLTMDIMTLIILDGDILNQSKRHKTLQFAIPKQVQVKAYEKMLLLCSVNTDGYESFRDGDVSCQYVMANLQHQLTNTAIPTNVSSLFKTKPLTFTKHQDWELYGLCDSLVIKGLELPNYQRIPISSVIHTAIPFGENHVLACSVDQIFKWNVKENMLEDECAEAWAQCQAAVFVNPSTVVLGTLTGIYVIDPNNNLDTPLVFKPFDMEGIQKVQLTTIGTPRPTKTEFLVCTNKAVLKYSYQLVNEHHTIQLRHVYQSPDIHFILQLLPSTESVYFAVRANHNDHPRVVCISGRSGRVCWQSEPLYSITTACANSYYGGTHVVYITHDRNLVLTRAIIDGSRIQLSTCKKPMSEDIDPCTLQVDSVNKVVILLTIPSDYGYRTVNLDENIENMSNTLHNQIYYYDQ